MQTIKLLSEEEMRRPYWQQYWQLKAAIKKTKDVLIALGVTEFPEEDPGCSMDIGITPLKKQDAQALATRKYSSEQQVSLISRIREACSVIRTNITRENVIAYIANTYPELEFNKVSVSAMLSNSLTKQGFLTLVEKGIGGYPSRYELAEVSQQNLAIDEN